MVVRAERRVQAALQVELEDQQPERRERQNLLAEMAGKIAAPEMPVAAQRPVLLEPEQEVGRAARLPRRRQAAAVVVQTAALLVVMPPVQRPERLALVLIVVGPGALVRMRHQQRMAQPERNGYLMALGVVAAILNATEPQPAQAAMAVSMAGAGVEAAAILERPISVGPARKD